MPAPSPIFPNNPRYVQPLTDAGQFPNPNAIGPSGVPGGFSTSTQQQTGSSGQYFQDPSLVGALSKSIGGAAGDSGGNFTNFVNNPVAHPLFQAQLQSLLQSLVPSEQAARQGMTDQFRAAGGLRSGAYGNAGAQLEGNILGNRQTEAGKLLGQSFPQIIQALLGSMGQGNQLIDALKMNQQQSQSTGGQYSQQYAPPPTVQEGQGILNMQKRYDLGNAASQGFGF